MTLSVRKLLTAWNFRFVSDAAFVPARLMVYPAAAALVLAVVWASPSGTATGRNGVELPTDEELAAQLRQLTDRQTAVDARLAYKNSVVAELVAGRVTLPAAAAAFWRVNQGEERCLAVIREAYVGKSDEEKAARNVLDFVTARTIPEPDRTRVLARLRRELTAEYGAD